ncbi:MAG: tRNA threonylcarbamoyladenosine dehydratase [Clostridia bacterium]|nr:tRNA threonylcarbamoyladenosine dehydratase [Clostridia bacterium]
MIFDRTISLIGERAHQRLQNARVAIFGLGGVGSYAFEALCRAGVGSMLLVDSDTIDETNINRQLLATFDTIGLYKADVAKNRAMSINPQCAVTGVTAFVDDSNISEFDLSGLDYVLDAIDTVKSKILIIEAATRACVPVISAMGAGNKLDPTLFRVDDIEKTSVCPLARVMRRELKARGLSVKAVYSTETPVKPDKSRVPASISFVPAAAGLTMAGYVVNEIIGDENARRAT